MWLRLRDAPRAVAGAARADFAAWVERNFFNARAGRIGGVSYARAGELDDALRESRRRPEDRWDGRALWYATAYERATIDHMEPLRLEELGFLLRSPHVALQLALGVTDLRGLRCLRRGLALEAERLQRRACRARYYARDNARRRALAAERRRMTRRTTTNPCPTPEALRAAFAARGGSPEAKVRLGSLLEDLECHVDNRLRLGPYGEILGRNGGVRGWLRAHAPELAARYKTLMRHKALARRLRQAAGLADPIPASAVFDGLPPETRGSQSVAPSACRPALSAERPTSASSQCHFDSSRLPSPHVADRDGGIVRRGDENYYAVNSHLEANRLESANNSVKESANRVSASSERPPSGPLGCRPDAFRLPALRDEGRGGKTRRRGLENYYAQDSHLAAARRLAAERRLLEARELVRGCENTFVALFRAIDDALDGDVPSTRLVKSNGRTSGADTFSVCGLRPVTARSPRP